MKKNICILGAGSWGCALALNLARNDYNVKLWTLSDEQSVEINKLRTNSKYLPNISIPNNIKATVDIEYAIKDSNMIVLAVPSQAIRSICKTIKPYVNSNQILIDVAKGLEKETGLTMSEVCYSELPNIPYTVLSGPSHAEEVALNLPTTVTVACKDINIAKEVQDAFSNNTFRVYISNDVTGVELGGALKNIIAFGAGICDGLGYGDNTKAALMTRGLYEISKLGTRLGADPKTFSGLSGIGDLIVTCTSIHSRNRKAGILIGQGKSLQETLDEVQMVVEGITATQVAHEVAKNFKIDTPIINGIYSILYENKEPKDVVDDLMERARKYEYDIKFNI